VKKAEDFDRILQVFEAHNIRYFHYIGGNDSQDTAANDRRPGQGARL